MGGPSCLPIRLTWRGHEFLDTSRSDSLWDKAKSTVLNKTGGLAFDVLFSGLKELATRLALGALDPTRS